MLFLLPTAYSQDLAFEAREATIDSVHHALFGGLNTCRQITLSFLARIEALNHNINAIITLNQDALSLADSLDVRLSQGNTTGSLFCVPVLLKDNYDTSNMKTTGGCLDLANSQPVDDAPTVKALLQAGAIILGKANLHELALEGLSVSSLGGQTINPYDFGRTPGGSSGGSGAAIAASFAVFATGTDTVNSLRSPASANKYVFSPNKSSTQANRMIFSLFSCRPTRGLITRSGVIPISYTQDAVGAIARSPSDLAVAITVMASTGFDANDNVTALRPMEQSTVDYTTSLTQGTLAGMRFGVLEGFFDRSITNETTPVNEAMNRTISILQQAGAVVIAINDSLYNATAISSSLDTQRFEYRQELTNYLQNTKHTGARPSTFRQLYNSGKFLVIPSQYEYVNTANVSSTSNATYDQVQYGIRNLTLALQETFASNNLDAILYPEQKTLVVKIGAPSQSQRNGILAALTGSPVVTVPIGFSPATADAPIGIPVGMEILGRPWSEEKLMQIAYQFDQRTHLRRTPAFAARFIEVANLTSVPTVTPNRSNIPSAYPIGILH